MRNGGRKGDGARIGTGEGIEEEKAEWEREKGRGEAGGTVHKAALVFHARLQIA